MAGLNGMVAIAPSEDELFEMVNLVPRLTGLPMTNANHGRMEVLSKHPLASRLQDYGFECVGTFSCLERQRKAFPSETVVYAFVARNWIKTYSYVDGGRQLADYFFHIAPSEVFYIGSAANLSARIAVHKFEVLKHPSRDEGWGVACKLRAAMRQNVPVDVYVRRIPDGLIVLHGLPVDLLRGAEMGLIRDLNPSCNTRRR
jgi:hypothetical protein